MKKLSILVTDETLDLLKSMAADDYRTPAQQASWVVLEVTRRYKALQMTEQMPPFVMADEGEQEAFPGLLLERPESAQP